MNQVEKNLVILNIMLFVFLSFSITYKVAIPYAQHAIHEQLPVIPDWEDYKPDINLRPPYIDLQAPDVSPRIAQLMDLHNNERNQHNVPILQQDAGLMQAAQQHADWMANNGKMSHRGENGSSPGDRIGPGYNTWGENVAMGQKTPAEVTRDWMNSSGHRRNILNGQFTHVGFGVAQDSQGRLYWCTCFGTPRY